MPTDPRTPPAPEWDRLQALAEKATPGQRQGAPVTDTRTPLTAQHAAFKADMAARHAEFDAQVAEGKALARYDVGVDLTTYVHRNGEVKVGTVAELLTYADRATRSASSAAEQLLIADLGQALHSVATDHETLSEERDGLIAALRAKDLALDRRCAERVFLLRQLKEHNTQRRHAADESKALRAQVTDLQAQVERLQREYSASQAHVAEVSLELRDVEAERDAISAQAAEHAAARELEQADLQAALLRERERLAMPPISREHFEAALTCEVLYAARQAWRGMTNSGDGGDAAMRLALVEALLAALTPQKADQ